MGRLSTYLILRQIDGDDSGVRKSERSEESLNLLFSSSVHQIANINRAFVL